MSWTTLGILMIPVHIAIAIFLIFGFCLRFEKYPTIRKLHTILGVTMLAFQAIFSCRCPLNLLMSYFIRLDHPEREISWLDDPFIVSVLRDSLGFEVPDLLITIIGILIVILSIVAWVVYRREQKSFQLRKALVKHK